MVNIANQDLLAKVKLERIRKVFFIGEVFPTKHLNYWRRHLPGAMFVNLYGPIEITVACTYYIVDREFADDEKLPVGFPMRNTDILILNDQNQPAKRTSRAKSACAEVRWRWAITIMRNERRRGLCRTRSTRITRN